MSRAFSAWKFEMASIPGALPQARMNRAVGAKHIPAAYAIGHSTLHSGTRTPQRAAYHGKSLGRRGGWRYLLTVRSQDFTCSCYLPSSIAL
jgi:hypothetical protein